MITVYYDGKCGLCSKEINYYKKISPPNVFRWINIMDSVVELNKKGIKLTQALKILHAIDDKGKIHAGIDAFILIWSQLKRWRMLAKLIKIPLIYQAASFAYLTFAKWRFKKLDHCQHVEKKDK